MPEIGLPEVDYDPWGFLRRPWHALLRLFGREPRD
jgi:hypothetical protein